MSAAPRSSSEIHSLEEITRQFPAEWVLLDSCRFAEDGSITHGRVIFRSSDRDEAYRELHRNPNSVLIFSGALSPEEDRPFLDPVSGLATV